MVANLILWHLSRASCKGWSSKWFFISRVNVAAIISMKNDSRGETWTEEKFNVLVPCVGRKRRVIHFIVMLLRQCHAFAPIIPHNLCFANKQLFKSFSMFCQQKSADFNSRNGEKTSTHAKTVWIFSAYTNYAFML